MRLQINDKIKELRKENKWTQEELAERLNVSPQAVSRWETNATFPDIELLPDIASIFDISVDELLGVNDILNNDRIKKLIEQANNYYDTDEVDKVVITLEKARKEYPTNISITLNLITALSALYSENRTDICKRIIELGNKIIDRLTDINDKCRLYQIMAYTHIELGNIELAKVYANKLPEMEYTSNLVLPSILEGKEKIKLIQENIQELVCNIIMQTSYLVNVANYTDNERIIILKKLDELIELMYENKDYLYTNWLLCGNNMNIAEIYAKQKDEKNTLLHISKAINYSELSNKKESNSLLNNILEQDKEKVFGKNFEKNEKNMILTRTKDKNFDFIRKNQEFIKLTENLEKIVNEVGKNMNFRRIDLEEYLERLPEEVKKLKLPKTYLQERLENGTAEYYLINEEDGFFIYKEENNVVDLNVYEKDKTSIFDNKEIMNSIFEFLKNQEFKTITMNLDKNQYKERQTLALEYGFKEIETLKQGDFEYIDYEKEL